MPSAPITPSRVPQQPRRAVVTLGSDADDSAMEEEESATSLSDDSASEDLTDESGEEEEGEEDDYGNESVARQKERQKKALKADITPHHRLEKRPQRETAARASNAWSHLTSSPFPSSANNKGKGRTIVEVVIDSPGRKRKEQVQGTGKDNDAQERQIKHPKLIPEVEILIPKAGPSKSPHRQSAKGQVTDVKSASSSSERYDGGEPAATRSPLSRRKPRDDGEEREVHTPTKKVKHAPRTPTKQPLPKTLSKSAASKRIADARASLSTNNSHLWATAATNVEQQQERLFIQPTSSDAYFAHHAPRSKRNAAKHVTSDSILSATFDPIPAEIVSRLSHDISERLLRTDDEEEEEGDLNGSIPSHSFLHPLHFEPCFDYWWSLLVCTNRPLLVYGVGSKRTHLQTFARYLAQDKGRCSAAVVIRGESGGRIEDVVRELERCVEASSQAVPSTAQQQMKRRKLFSTMLEARAHNLVKALEGTEEDEDADGDGEQEDGDCQEHFLVLIHNFDTPLLLQDRSLHVLSILSSCRRIHLCVDTCHINSGLLTSLHADQEQASLPWLWINMNTFVPQLEELINERGSGTSRVVGLPRVLDIRSAGGGSGGGLDYYSGTFQASSKTAANGAASGGAASSGNAGIASSITTNLLSERAAIHILRSVTSKARDLFLLLAAQLSKDDGSNTTTYSDLASLASRNFKATNAEALRSLLVEFTTHNLIRVQGFDNGEQLQNQGVPSSTSTVSIALSKRDLRRVSIEFSAES